MTKSKPIENREKAIANKEYRKQETGNRVQDIGQNNGGSRVRGNSSFFILYSTFFCGWREHPHYSLLATHYYLEFGETNLALS